MKFGICPNCNNELDGIGQCTGIKGCRKKYCEECGKEQHEWNMSQRSLCDSCQKIWNLERQLENAKNAKFSTYLIIGIVAAIFLIPYFSQVEKDSNNSSDYLDYDHFMESCLSNQDPHFDNTAFCKQEYDEFMEANEQYWSEMGSFQGR